MARKTIISVIKLLFGAGVVILAIYAFIAFSGESTDSYGYPSSYKSKSIGGCKSNLKDLVKSRRFIMSEENNDGFCQCQFEEKRSRFSYEDALELDRRYEAGEVVTELDEITRICAVSFPAG